METQSVPSRISVVLVEEAKVGGTPCLGCPRVDQDLRLLAGVAKPVSVTVCEDSHVSQCVGGRFIDAVLFRPRREAVSGCTCWDTVPSRSCWPYWPVWDSVPV